MRKATIVDKPKRTVAHVIGGILIAAIPGVAAGQWWNPQSPIAPGKWAALESSFVYSNAVYLHATQAIPAAVHAGDFAKLDRMHDEFLAMLAKGGNGDRMLAAFTEGFEAAFRGGGDRFGGFFDEWRKRAPESKLRPAAEAAMWHGLAWDARGGGYASGVSPEAMRIFRGHLDRAMAALRDGEAAGKASPLWYWAALSVAGSRGDASRLLDGFFEEGAGRFPRFMPLYDTRLNYLLPQWGGNYDRVDAFIRAAVMRTQAVEGTWLYADLYTSVFAKFREDDFFRRTRASWRLMKHGFEDGIARKVANLNDYATYACIARDRDTTRQLLAELGPKANLGAGKEGFTTEACEALVKEGK